MTNEIDALKKVAVMEADKVKEKYGTENSAKVNLAYEHARQLDSLVCPICWIWDGVTAKLQKTESKHVCNNCDYEFPQSLP